MPPHQCFKCALITADQESLQQLSIGFVAAQWIQGKRGWFSMTDVLR